MKNNCKFSGFLFLSALIHAGFLAVFPLQITRPLMAKRQLEISYARTIPVSSAPNEAIVKRPLPGKVEIPSLADKIIMPAALLSEVARKPTAEDEEAVLKTVVSLVDIGNVPEEAAAAPEYKIYNAIIGNKIQKVAAANYDKNEEGRVFLTFSLTPAGEIIDVLIDDRQSSPSPYLRQTAQKSVREAAPSPELFEKLKLRHKLAFCAVISFELR